MSTDTYIDIHVGPEPDSEPADCVRIGYLHNFVCDSQWISGAKQVDELGHEFPISTFGLFRTKWHGARVTTDNLPELLSEYRRIYHNAQKDQNNDFKNDILTADEIRQELLNALGHFIRFRVD